MGDYFDLHLEQDALNAVSNLGLAHLGDAVYEVMVRAKVCSAGPARSRQLHQDTIRLVSAPAQAARAERILPMLTEEEADVFRRGRNTAPHTVPHHATRAQYQAATALECLFGWLYLQGRRQRLNELFAVMMEESGDAT